MDPFGNFGWDFGFGFGWILIGITVVLLVLAIVQLVRFSLRDDRRRSEEQAALNSLKREICAGEIGLEEFEKKIKNMAS